MMSRLPWSSKREGAGGDVAFVVVNICTFERESINEFETIVGIDLQVPMVAGVMNKHLHRQDRTGWSGTCGKHPVSGFQF